MGMPIVNEQDKWKTPKPAYTKDPKRTTEVFTDLSKAVNSMLGGTDTVPGEYTYPFTGALSRNNEAARFDLSGAEIEHVLRSYLGGPMDLVTMFLSGGNAVVSDGDIRPDKIVGVRRFWRGTAGDFDTLDRFYSLRDRVNIAQLELNKLKVAGDASSVRMWQKEHAPLLKMKKVIDATDKKLVRVREQIQKAELGDPSPLKKQQVENLQEKRINIFLEALGQASKLNIST